jgi:hypothetical protein
MAKQAKSAAPNFKCTHGAGGLCIKWEWDDADQYWTIPAGTCDCGECPGFLDHSIHSLVLAHFISTGKAKE